MARNGIWMPLVLLSHFIALLMLLLDSYAKAFTGLRSPLPAAALLRQLQLRQNFSRIRGACTPHPTTAAGGLEATPQRKDIENEESEDRDAESRVVIERFKHSVLDENGRVRRMSQEQAREVARAAADGILLQAEREAKRKLPVSAHLGARGGEGGEYSGDLGDSYGSPSRGGLTSGHGDPVMLTVKQDKAGGGKDGDGELCLDWGNGSEGRRQVAARESRGVQGGRPVLPATPEVEAEYQSTLVELKAYHAQHGNLLLTHEYATVGEDGGAVRCRGWRLGQKVYNMKFWKKHVRDRPGRRAELATMGFIWGSTRYSNYLGDYWPGAGGLLAADAIGTLASLDKVVTDPMAVGGMDGRRRGKREEGDEPDEYNLFLEALLAYKDMEGSLLVPSSFIVPEETPWPLCCQGMRLGAKVAGVRNQSLYVRADVSRWYQLDAMGFVWDLSDAPFRQVYEALLQYRALHGNLHVPVAFRVPGCPPWEEDLQGLALGQRVLDIRARHRYVRNEPDRIRLLNAAGFLWTDSAKSSYANVVRALKAYRKVKGRDFSVPSSFVVPSFLPWPQSCWGLRLGTALVDIRSKGRYLKGDDSEQRRAELERLGVFAQSREAILANVVKGLRCYLNVVGDALVPQGFVVPEGSPWPRECWGQKLGSMLYGLRRRPERLDRHPSVHVELTALGFSWEVPKKGPRGPRKRKVVGTLSSNVNDSNDGAAGSSVTECFVTAAPSETEGNAQAPWSLSTALPRPTPSMPLSEPRIAGVTLVSNYERHQPCPMLPNVQSDALADGGRLDGDNTKPSSAKDLAVTEWVRGESIDRSDGTARIPDARARRTGYDNGRDQQGNERRNSGLLAPAARWLLGEGGALLERNGERGIVAKR